MDMTMIDVSDIPGVRVGDECVVLGSQKGSAGENTISAEDIARQLGTIPWEVLTNISRRVPRFYREP
jgi:alanine racemase